MNPQVPRPGPLRPVNTFDHPSGSSVQSARTRRCFDTLPRSSNSVSPAFKATVARFWSDAPFGSGYTQDRSPKRQKIAVAGERKMAEGRPIEINDDETEDWDKVQPISGVGHTTHRAGERSSAGYAQDLTHGHNDVSVSRASEYYIHENGMRPEEYSKSRSLSFADRVLTAFQRTDTSGKDENLLKLARKQRQEDDGWVGLETPSQPRHRGEHPESTAINRDASPDELQSSLVTVRTGRRFDLTSRRQETRPSLAKPPTGTDKSISGNIRPQSVSRVNRITSRTAKSPNHASVSTRPRGLKTSESPEVRKFKVQQLHYGALPSDPHNYEITIDSTEKCLMINLRKALLGDKKPLTIVHLDSVRQMLYGNDGCKIVLLRFSKSPNLLEQRAVLELGSQKEVVDFIQAVQVINGTISVLVKEQ